MALTPTRFWKLIRYPDRDTAPKSLALDESIERHDVAEAHERLWRDLSDCQNDWPRQLKTTPAPYYLASLDSPASQASMASRLRRFAQFFGFSDWHQVAWECLALEDLAVFRATMNEPVPGKKERRMSPELFNSTRAAVRGVVNAAFDLGLIDGDRLKSLQSVKSRKQPRNSGPKGRMLSMREQEDIMQALPADEPMLARDRAIFATLLFTGLRRSEIAGLRMHDIVLGESVRVVGGKGQQNREIPMSEYLDKALMDWLRHYHSRDGVEPRDNDPLFCRLGRWGVVTFQPITGQAVYDILKRLCERRDFKKALPHDLRRTFISMVLKATKDISVAQRLAGHSSPVTTSIYDLRGEDADKHAIHSLDSLYGGDNS